MLSEIQENMWNEAAYAVLLFCMNFLFLYRLSSLQESSGNVQMKTRASLSKDKREMLAVVNCFRIYLTFNKRFQLYAAQGSRNTDAHFYSSIIKTPLALYGKRRFGNK